ncbi:MAG: formylglycine-generating enzyme family protein [Deltaproteobacteria bacterium]|nr:formylglycine-generating enzyme family protein [Deltaproteobacteria bacterium]
MTAHAVELSAALLLCGCGGLAAVDGGYGGAVVDAGDAGDAGGAAPPIRCHTGFEARQDERGEWVCRVVEIYFEGGTFTMGQGYCWPPEEHAEEFADGRCQLSDQPHERTVGPFYLDAVEVAGSQLFELGAWEGTPYGCASLSLDCDWGNTAWLPEPAPSRDAALETCEALGKTLPTEAQWELAASGGGQRTYPWGDHPPTCDDAEYDEANCGPPDAEVGSHPPSPEGVYDLAGSVAEFVLHEPEHYTESYPDTPFFDPKECTGFEAPLSTCHPEMVRGGDFRSGAGELRAAHRAMKPSWQRDPVAGARCVRVP